MTLPHSPRSVFISYAHADNESADPKKRWVDRFVTFLKPFVRQEDFTVASDQDILIGDDWHEQLQTHLARAQAAVLLVSPDFLASDYIANSEVPVLLKKSVDAGLKIFSIIISPCSYQRTKFNYPDPKAGPDELRLSSLQAANPPSKTLVEMEEGAQNRTMQKVAEQLADLLNPFAEPPGQEAVAGKILPQFDVVGAEARPVPIRPLLRDLERSLANGDLKDSELAPDVLATLQAQSQLDLAKPFESSWIITGIRAGDNYFAPIRRSAGQRDWQRDFGKTATPILVGVARSLERSADAQAVVLRLCNIIAKRLRLQLVWPDDPNELNDLKNAIYRACLDARELECDEVLVELQSLTVIGPE